MTADKGRIFGRICKVTAGGRAVEKLRVGFTVDKSLSKEMNRAQLSIYNLNESSRNAFTRVFDQIGKQSKEDGLPPGVPIVIEAGYEETGLNLIFAGEAREGFSRRERDGSWLTILRAGDGDMRKSRNVPNTTGIRPGVSIDRVFSDLAQKMGVGIGNVGAELAKGNFSFEGLGQVFSHGLNVSGSDYDLMQKLARSAGRELSIQDGQLQIIERRGALSVKATVLRSDTGLEGSPEVDPKGEMSFRARLLPGLMPGYPVEIESTASYGSGLWRIEKVHIVGDTFGPDWTVEAKCREIRTRKGAA